jgi:hypothetical protein
VLVSTSGCRSKTPTPAFGGLSPDRIRHQERALAARALLSAMRVLCQRGTAPQCAQLLRPFWKYPNRLRRKNKVMGINNQPSPHGPSKIWPNTTLFCRKMTFRIEATRAESKHGKIFYFWCETKITSNLKCMSLKREEKMGYGGIYHFPFCTGGKLI